MEQACWRHQGGLPGGSPGKLLAASELMGVASAGREPIGCRCCALLLHQKLQLFVLWLHTCESVLAAWLQHCKSHAFQ